MRPTYFPLLLAAILAACADSGAKWGLGDLRELVDARLLTSYDVEAKEGEPSRHRIEVVHESLLKAWPRLVRWQTQDEEGALLRDQLKQAARLWEEKGRTPDLLWSGTAFREYELWRERYPGKLTALEEEFSSSMVERARRWRRIRWWSRQTRWGSRWIWRWPRRTRWGARWIWRWPRRTRAWQMRTKRRQ